MFSSSLKSSAQRVKNSLLISAKKAYSLSDEKGRQGESLFDTVYSKLNWRTSEDTKALRMLNHLRVPLIKQTLLQDKSVPMPAKPLNGFKIIDVGCGPGLLCEPLARLGAQVVGIDTSSSLIKMAQDYVDKETPELASNLTFVSSTLENYVNDQTRESFNAAVLSEVLEHVHDVGSILEQCSQLIKPEGNIIITTINQTVLAQLVVITFGETILKLLPKGTHDYQMFIPPNSLKLFLENSKLFHKHNCIKFYLIKFL